MKMVKKIKKSKAVKKQITKKEKKENKIGQILISIFFGFLMVSSILAITLRNNQETMKFNNIKFTRTDNGWNAKINNQDYQFIYSPKDLIFALGNLNNISFEREDYKDSELIEISKEFKEYSIIQNIKNKNQIYLTTNVNSIINVFGDEDNKISQEEYMEIISIENSKFLFNQIFLEKGIDSQIGVFYDENNNEVISKIQVYQGYLKMNQLKCGNDTTTLIYKADKNNNIEINNNCVIINFNSLEYLNLVNEYILYYLVEVY